MRAEPFRLLAHIVHQIRTHDAIGKAWEILHFGGVDQLAAGRQRAGDDQRLEAGAAKIDRGSIASRAGTDNHHITHITHGCYCNAVSTTVAGGFADGVQKSVQKGVQKSQLSVTLFHVKQKEGVRNNPHTLLVCRCVRKSAPNRCTAGCREGCRTAPTRGCPGSPRPC